MEGTDEEDMERKLNWELIEWGLSRVPIPGGWLVRADYYTETALTFVPDAHHV